MTQYKLTYFAVRGIAEPIRLILALNQVPFEDYRISWEEWDEPGNLKNKIGFGKLPVLEFDGKQLTQSITIMRYLAKIYNLIPKDDFLSARCDETMDYITELRLEFRPFVMEKDEEIKAKIKSDLIANSFPKYYGILNELVSKTSGPFIAGDELSWTDLAFANWLEIWDELVLPLEFLAKYPALQILKGKVFDLPALANYLKTRPKTWI